MISEPSAKAVREGQGEEGEEEEGDGEEDMHREEPAASHLLKVDRGHG